MILIFFVIFSKSYKVPKNNSTSTLRSHLNRNHKNLLKVVTSGEMDKYVISNKTLVCRI